MLAEAAGRQACDVETGRAAGYAKWDPIRRIRVASEPDFLSPRDERVGRPFVVVTLVRGDLRGPWRTWNVALTEI